MDGFMIGYDPCHGFDFDPRSPYYKDPREQVYTCDLCGEPIYEDERIVIYGDKVIHYDDIFSSDSDEKQIAKLFGFEITKEVGIPCAHCREETDEWDEIVRCKGKTYHFDCFFNLPVEALAKLLGFEITTA